LDDDNVKSFLYLCKSLELTGDERYSVSKLKKRFDGLKKSSYICKTNREESKNVPEVRLTSSSHQMVWIPDDSSLNNMVVVAQLLG
jgi:hypothetical protein